MIMKSKQSKCHVEKPRQYLTVERVTLQDGWVVELRERQSGCHKGDIYKVFINPQGHQRYTLRPACTYMVLSSKCCIAPAFRL